VQLVIGVICMACVANMQYGWTLFVDPLDAKYHWGRVDIQWAFTIFVTAETWLQPLEGYLVDRFGPRWVVIGGAVLVAAAWIVDSGANSLPILYLAAAAGGAGTGAVYGTCVGNALKWFPGRRGLAAGITAAGFGAGSALTIGPIGSMIAAAGYERAFWVFGLIQGAGVFVLAWLLRAPSAQPAPVQKADQTARGYSPAEVLHAPVFYVLYAMFALVASGGLTVAASIASIARDVGIAHHMVRLFGFALQASVFAVSLSRICDGFGRPFFGWLSDRIGREYTMALAFFVGAAALLVLSRSAANPVVFVLMMGLYFGVFGEIFSLFPATQGDTFGSRYAAANAGMLYTAKGVGALLPPIAAGLAKVHGWGSVFALAMSFNVIAGSMALLVLKPLRARHFAKHRELQAPGRALPATRAYE
jgi:OFA family oxalate/formate antiporter-like MFS transporter